MGTNKTNTREEVLEVIKAMPGCTTSEIVELMPHASHSAVCCMVHNLKREGRIREGDKKSFVKKNGAGGKLGTYFFVDGPAAPAPRVMKRNTPTASGYEVRLAEKDEKIRELEAWKDAAIKRYPDLAVPPVTLKARKIVADELRAGGDPVLADQVMKGFKDNTLMVRVTIKALEEDV